VFIIILTKSSSLYRLHINHIASAENGDRSVGKAMGDELWAGRPIYPHQEQDVSLFFMTSVMDVMPTQARAHWVPEHPSLGVKLHLAPRPRMMERYLPYIFMM
jgi:hypothetical protein